MKNPIVTIKIKDGKTIKLELFPNEAPESVKNFISLINKGFYNNTAFWRVENKKLIQGGCPENNGTGVLGYSIKSECKANGINNNLKFTRGTIGYGRFEYNTESCHFFIVTQETPQLDDTFAAFGRVISGMDEVDRISKVKTELEVFFHRAIDKVFIESITVNTFGVIYDEPSKLPGLSKEETLAKWNATIEERKKTGYKVI
ncbi:peptidylprolyl isomerase [Paraclostridium bifermentans]|uniref:peptidylprolyl isomerase n=1 Tax=Paraclostridium bifermentans TaxID=1490 RepID=UPI00359C8B45